MNLNELCDKFAPDTSKILLEFSPGKTESLIAHFLAKNPSVTRDTIAYVVNKYSELLNVNDNTGQPVISNTDGLRDIDKLIAKNGGNGWSALLELIYDNAFPTDLPESITKIPGGVSLIIDEGGIKVYRAETHNRCMAIRQVIFEIPAFKAVYDNLLPSQRTSQGKHPFGWCVTFPETHYYSYRREGSGDTRSFYFIIDSNRPVTDPWCISVVQPRSMYPDRPFITDMKNSSTPPSNGITTWDFIYDLYPILRNHPQLPYDEMHPAERSNEALIGKNYIYLPSEKIKKDPYIYRWYMANPNLPLPIDRFLTLSKPYRDSYIKSRAYTAYTGNPNSDSNYNGGRLFTTPSGNRVLSLREVISQLQAKNQQGLIRNIVALYSHNINNYTLEIDSDGLPIVTAIGELAVVNEPIIIERLPTSRKYIYGKLIKSGTDGFTPLIYHILKSNIKVPIDPDTLTDPADKAIYDEMFTVLQVLVLYYLNKSI